ncbi:MAG TPA: exopolysaccharide biosynthesis protein [Gaiellaceae bacterium]|nr:exopolysaccharide biosynthesis protein [Gaiellaceae bacterium]
MFSDELERWLESDGPKTLEALNAVFAERAFAVGILLMMLVPALPLPTGGVSHLLEVVAIVLAAEMVLGRRTVWVPARWKDRELGATITGKTLPFVMRRIRQVERFSRRRGSRLFGQRWFNRILGLVLIALALAAALAPPFSGLDTLPSLGAVVVALSILLEDLVVLVVGLVIGTGGIVLILTVGAALVRLLTGLL